MVLKAGSLLLRGCIWWLKGRNPGLGLNEVLEEEVEVRQRKSGCWTATPRESQDLCRHCNIIHGDSQPEEKNL